MVTTRRQSGVLPVPATSSVPVLTDWLDDEASDSGSNYSQEWRPSKRAKLATTGKRSTQKGKGHDLSILPSITFDILFEIFGHLCPGDLLNLTRTNKELRQLLLSRQSTSVWKHARQRILHAPECPADVSEPHWANLIFGGSVCHECGARNVQKVNFELRRRVCSKCLKFDLVSAGSFARKFPDFDIAILDLLPYTHSGNTIGYWRSDIYRMAKTLEEYTNDVHLGKPGAEQALEDFKTARVQLLESIMQHVNKYRDWNTDVAQERAKEIQERKLKRRRQITERFVQLGYLEVELRSLAGLHEVEDEKELTDRIWKRIRPILEPIVITARQERRQRLIDSRTRTFEQVYLRYKETLLPSQWASVPPINDVYTEESFAKLINEDSNRKMRIMDFSDALKGLPAFAAAWVDQKKQMLLALVSSANSGNASSSLPAANSNVELSLTPVEPMCDDVLESPTSVFVCNNETCKPRNEPIVGRDCLLSHECSNSAERPETQEAQLAFSQRGCVAVAQIVALVGLPVGLVDLDNQDLRFVCEGNTGKCINNGGRIAYTWRKAVAHFIGSSGLTHPEPYFRILTPEVTISVKSREGADPSFAKRCWTCNHCSTYINYRCKQANVIDHLATVHKITSPRVGSDLSHHPGIIRDQCKPVGIDEIDSSTVNPKEKAYICLMCSVPSERLFDLGGVMNHLRAKHKVIRGQHWQKIENSSIASIGANNYST